MTDDYADLLSMAWAGASLSSTTRGDIHFYPEYLDRLVDFQRHVLGQRLWAAQSHVSSKLIEHRRVALRSCRKTGKTHNAGGIVNGFIAAGPSVVITTAPTGRQVRELLWGQIRTQHARSRRPLPGECGVVALRVTPEWYAIGFSTDDPENILGFHAGVRPPKDDTYEELEAFTWEAANSPDLRLLLLIDEAPGVEPALFDAMKGSLSGPNAYALVQGNPLLASDSPHFFSRIHQPGSGWHRVHIGCYEPAEGEDDVGADACFHEVPNWLVDQEWIEGCEHDWGVTHPMYRAHVGGMFSSGDITEQRVIPRTTLEAAEVREGTSPMGRHIGVDIAREGSDDCVAVLWVNGVKAAEHVWSKVNLMATADVILALTDRWKGEGGKLTGERVHIDVVGVGGGVVDRLRQQGLYVDGVDFGAGPQGEWDYVIGDTVRMRNRRAELHWAVRRLFDEGKAHLPKRFTNSWQQAQWARYELKDTGSTGTVLTIEKKDLIKARHGRSPDHWDADLMAFSRGGGRPRFAVMKRR